MPRSPASDPASQSKLSMRLGGWFEAHATGWGIAAIPGVLALVLALAAIKMIWR